VITPERKEENQVEISGVALDKTGGKTAGKFRQKEDQVLKFCNCGFVVTSQ
jgi:hypothetical protein